ncbi:hypothetical protein JST56_02905 [Candidatus Dependentiae bacterium]|nr:hypothetical protein [Candidatus Dependentiae bacterium]
MLLSNQGLVTKSFVLISLYLVLVVSDAYSMDANNNNFFTPPVSPLKRKADDTTQSPSKHLKKNLDSSCFASPEREFPSSPTRLTPSMKDIKLYSPVGLKTPKKYVNTKPTSEILKLFITNFLHYDEQSSLTPLIKFLFLLDQNSGELQRSCAVLDQQRDPHALFPQFLWSEMNEDFFDTLLKKYHQMIKVLEFQQSLRACKTDKERSNKEKTLKAQIAHIEKQLQSYFDDQDLIKQKETLQEMLKVIPRKVPEIKILNLVKKHLFEKIDTILDEKYRLENCGNACIEKPLKVKRCNTCSQFNISAVQKKWLETLLKHLITIYEEQDRTLCNRYQKIARYLLGFYLYPWKPQCKLRYAQILSFSSDDEDIDDQDIIPAPFDLIPAALKLLSHNAAHSDFINLLPERGILLKFSNAELIEDCIQQSPLYYLLCFNMQEQKIIERIENICTGRYEPIDSSKNSMMLSELVNIMIEDYKNSLEEFTQSPPSASLLSKVKYAKYVLTKTFELITNHLTQPCQDTHKPHIMLPDCSNLCSYSFKDLIRTALMIKNVLQLQNSFLDNLIMVKNHHIEQVTYELHETKKVYQLGGGHLDCALPYNLTTNHGEHTVCEVSRLASNPTTGVSFCDWSIYDDQKKYASHKSSTVFPSCFNQEFWSQYVLKLLSQNADDRDFCLYDSGNRMHEKDGVCKRMIIFQHKHTLGCKSHNCLCDQNSLMYIAAIIREEVIDKSEDYGDQANILRSLISLYPLSAYCLDYDGNQDCFFLNGEKIDDDDQLNNAIPNYLGKTSNHTQLKLDQDGKPIHTINFLSCSAIYEVLLTAREKVAATNPLANSGDINTSIIEITNPATHDTYVLVKVAQGIVVKMLKTDLLKI